MKGLRSLDVTVADVVPSFVPNTITDSITPREAYKPNKRPVKGKTEMNQEERHTAHLRKKRQLKQAKRAEESKMKVMARFDPKIKQKLERGKVMETLSGNKNVTIVGHTGMKEGGKKVGGKAKVAAIKEATEKRGGKRWKHDLTRTLTGEK